MTMVLVEQFAMYSTYSDSDGRAIRIPHRTFLVEFDKDEMLQMWNDILGNTYNTPLRVRRKRQEFKDYLARILIEPDLADEVAWCHRCENIDMFEDGSQTYDGFVCESCFDEYYSECEHCNEYKCDVTSIRDYSVCERCRDSNYSFCDECDDYYHHDDEDEHRHDGSGCCESPELDFVIRNDGDPLLANDTRVTISLPAGTISSQGLDEIGRYLNSLRLYEVTYLLGELGDAWQTSKGNFTKRLSRLAYNKLRQKLEPEVLSRIGCIARDHSTAVDFAIEITRNLNLSAYEFAHGDSCWWGSYSGGRCALKTNGGFALRAFESCGDVSGRAWILPLKGDHGSLEPTFETEKPSAFMVFNCYGTLSGYNAARIISHMVGWTYRKINFTCQPMFINGDTGYLIAPEELAAPYTDGCLSLETDYHSNLHHTERLLRKRAAEAAVLQAETEKEFVNV